MPKTSVVREIAIQPSFRVNNVTSMYDVPLQARAHQEWEVDIPIDSPDDAWQVGLIVGPSGSGKTSIARDLWPESYVRTYSWPDDASILDAFPEESTVKDIIGGLVSVGFSSPPDWVKPYGALSTGQQMRADLARALIDIERGRLVVFDEFTSVVDRTVAKVGSAALARAVRRVSGQRFIAVTCHEDVVDWLTPDWVYEPHTATFSRRSLQPGYDKRPPIRLDITRVHSSAWRLFKQHHYLSHELNPSAVCYLAEWAGQPVAFGAVLNVIGFKNVYRESRMVVLPDYQGVGIGGAFTDFLGDLYVKAGHRFRATAGHPGLNAHRNRSPKWALVTVGAVGLGKHGGKYDGKVVKRQKVRASVASDGRSVATFEYIGTSADSNDETGVRA